MITRALSVAMLCLAASGCAQGAKSTEGAPGFDPGPVPAGYVRFTMPPIDLAPGEEVLVNQWLAGPAEADMDVADTRGGQSAPGHHIVLYSTSDIEPVGTTRPPNATDQLNQRTIGAIGGEGGATATLPPGVFFRLVQGRGIAANVHYINATSAPAVGRSYIDLKLVPPAPDHVVASFFGNLTLNLSVGPHAETEQEVSCKVAHDVTVIGLANHMHDLGTAALTTLEKSGGGQVELVRNDTWQREWEFAPPIERWSPEAPLVLSAGDTLHTHCTWKNPGAQTVQFPTEMCVAFGFLIADKDINCIDGQWLE